MSGIAKRMREEGLALLKQAKAICDHANHRHDYDADGPGYTCNDCGEFGYALACPASWPCERRQEVSR